MRTICTPQEMTAGDAIGAVSPGYRLVGISAGQFSMVDVLDAVIDSVGAGGTATLGSWTIASSEIERVARFVAAGRWRNLRLVLDRSFATRHPGYAAALIDRIGMDALRVTRTHAKFAMYSVGDYRIVCRASFNLNASPRCEQFDIDDNPEIYELFDGFVGALQVTARPGLDYGGDAEWQELFPALGPRTIDQVMSALASRLGGAQNP